MVLLTIVWKPRCKISPGTNGKCYGIAVHYIAGTTEAGVGSDSDSTRTQTGYALFFRVEIPNPSLCEQAPRHCKHMGHVRYYLISGI